MPRHWFYDSNRITIEGHTDLTFSEDVAARFRTYGWQVERIADVNAIDRIASAIAGSAAGRKSQR
jgi:transketolase